MWIECSDTVYRMWNDCGDSLGRARVESIVNGFGECGDSVDIVWK